MSDNVVDFPKEDLPDLLLGPFQVYHVIVEGRVIPKLTGRPEGDKTALVVDGRFSISVDNDIARDLAWIIAQAMAVTAGFGSLSSEGFAPMAVILSEMPK